MFSTFCSQALIVNELSIEEILSREYGSLAHYYTSFIINIKIKLNP